MQPGYDEGGEQIITEKDALEFIEAGCDASTSHWNRPRNYNGTYRGLVKVAFQKGVLTMTLIHKKR